jgi:hypothetical protein
MAQAQAAAPGLFAARPRIEVAGQASPALSDGLQALVVEETGDGMARLEATFGNWGPKNGGVGFLYFDRALIDFGKRLKIEAGAGQAGGLLFDGRVMAIEGRYARDRAPELLVLAEDRLQDLRMTRRTRTFENVTDKDVIQQIASAHSLQASADVSGPTHTVIAQVNQSDLAFLRERARACDAELWIDGTTLHVQARGRRRGASVSLAYGHALLEFAVMADLSGQASGFNVSGWDVAGKEAVSARATDSALSGELGQDDSGSKVLSAAIGDRDQSVVHELPLTAAAARGLAEAYYRRAARRFVSGRGVAEGDARLRGGASLSLSGLGTLFDGRYYVARAEHSFDPMRGYRTTFDVERPGLGR